MAPVPARTMRLGGLEDADRTQFYSVNTLLERGRAVAAREQARASESEKPAAVEQPAKPGILQQLRQASLVRKASALLLLLLISLLLVKPVFKKKPKPSNASVGTAASSTPRLAPATPSAVPPSTTPPEPVLSLPRGVSPEKAAADAVAAGDFQRAGALYRELSRREPGNAAYREAERILERRRRAQTP